MSSGEDVTSWLQVAGENMFSMLSNLDLTTNDTYDIVLRTVNKAGFTSDTITTSFTVEMLPPYNTGMIGKADTYDWCVDKWMDGDRSRQVHVTFFWYFIYSRLHWISVLSLSV